MPKKEDQRAFFKIDVGYLSNPKIAPLLDDQPRAVILHLECIAYAAQHLTDGIVPIRLAMRIACAEQCDLEICLKTGLLRAVNDTHVEVHDYLLHQRSAESVKGASEQAKLAAQARWDKAREDAESDADSTAERKAEREERINTLRRGPADADRLDVERVCKHLADRIEANGSKRPVIGKTWRDAARLMLDRDGRTEQQVHGCIDWCQNDEFWRSNILSMPTLRKQYDQLRLKAAAQGQSIDPTRGYTGTYPGGRAPLPGEIADDGTLLPPLPPSWENS